MHPLWTGDPWELTDEQMRDAGMIPRVVTGGLLFDLRTLPHKYDDARDGLYRPMFTSWLGEVWTVAGTRFKGEPRGPSISLIARFIHAACVDGGGSACVTFAAIAEDAFCAPATAERVIRFLERRGMIAKSRGKTATGKSGNVYRLRGLG